MRLIVQDSSPLAKIEADLALLKRMVSLNVALSIAVLMLLFVA